MSIKFQNTPFNQKVTILDDAKLALHGEPIEGNQGNRVPKLNFSIRGNYPHIRIALNNGKTGKDGKMDLALDLLSTTMIITALEEATRAKQPMNRVIAVKQKGWDAQAKKATDPYVAYLVVVGKNADGVEFIGIQRGQNQNSKNYLRLTFYFTPPEFHPLLDQATGQTASRQDVSNLVARAYVKLLSSLIPTINANVWDYATTNEGKWAIDKAKENPQGQQNQGYQGSNYNRNNNSNNYNNQSNGYNNPSQNQGYQSSSTEPAPVDKPFDDDVPW